MLTKTKSNKSQRAKCKLCCGLFAYLVFIKLNWFLSTLKVLKKTGDFTGKIKCLCSNQSLHYPDYERRPLHFQVRVLECVSAEACFAIHSLIRNYHIYRVIIKYHKTHRNV